VLSRQFHDFDRQRDEEIFFLLDAQQQVSYDEIQHERDAKVNELRKEIGSAMEKAGAEVRAILTPDQQKKYDEFKKKYETNYMHHGPGGTPPWRGGPGRHPHPGSPDSGPTPGGISDTAPAR
jgi:Spy/CpxP family protein refolding chaperone